MKRKTTSESRFKVFPASGFSTKHFETVVHSTQTALTAAYESALKAAGEGALRRCAAPVAFFRSRVDDPLTVGELHFCRSSFDAPTVSHEAAHATVEWFRRDSADKSVTLDHEGTEEVFARVLENIVAQVLLGFVRQ